MDLNTNKNLVNNKLNNRNVSLTQQIEKLNFDQNKFFKVIGTLEETLAKVGICKSNTLSSDVL